VSSLIGVQGVAGVQKAAGTGDPTGNENKHAKPGRRSGSKGEAFSEE
jgi:hypothetical protein